MIERSLKIMTPPVLADTDSNRIFFSIKVSFNRLITEIKKVLTESIPGKAVDTLPIWYDDFNLLYDPSLPLAQRQRIISGIYTAIGAQNPAYLRDQLQESFPTVDFIERVPPDPNFYYALIGTVKDTKEYLNLISRVRKLFPLHLEYIDFVDIEETIYLAICGVAICGSAQCGRGPE